VLKRDTTCCVVGGGPAGMMLGLLLARAGVEVVVLEKHADFLRDFRGDTIHPSTLELMHELGVLEEFLRLPHRKVDRLGARFGATYYSFADFSHLPLTCKFVALMPQWDFLNFIAGQGRRYPGFTLIMQAEATGLLMDGERVAGVRAETPDGPLDVRAALTVGCDGRHSTVRREAGLVTDDIGAPMDVLWFRLSRKADDNLATGGVFDRGRIFVMLDRGDYWQCAYVIAKGSMDEVKRRGIEAFRAELAKTEPGIADRTAELADWKQIHLLTVTIDRLRTWHRAGLLCIGDAAHAMSPVGGVGVNLAVQDAVAAANALADPLYEGRDVTPLLGKVQERREFPTRMTQRIQVVMQNTVISGALKGGDDFRPPLPLRLMDRFPVLRRIPARILGLGIRPEHVETPERPARQRA
jgi:2-polyprenyl-6-methoxyphenol hydroxylase-like FAD-dependent oxidoreductase